MRVYPKMAIPDRHRVIQNTENSCERRERLDSNIQLRSRLWGKELDHPFPLASCRASMLQMVRSTRMLSPSAETCPKLLATSLGEPSAIAFGETGTMYSTAKATAGDGVDRFGVERVPAAQRRGPAAGCL
jgi:hypothetical protein